MQTIVSGDMFPSVASPWTSCGLRACRYVRLETTRVHASRTACSFPTSAQRSRRRSRCSGFSDQAQLCNRCRRLVGDTPGAWRCSHRDEIGFVGGALNAARATLLRTHASRSSRVLSYMAGRLYLALRRARACFLTRRAQLNVPIEPAANSPGPSWQLAELAVVGRACLVSESSSTQDPRGAFRPK
jgi:hypothetical protein